MGKDAGAQPQAPDPLKIIPAQAAADRSAFNYQTDANRYNTAGPDSTQTWNKTSVFDQSAYDKALANWSSSGNSGTWVPGTPAQSTGNGTDQNPLGNTPATSGHWEGASGPVGDRPSQDAFTSNKYDLSTVLSPQAAALHSAEQGTATSKNQIAQALMDKLGGTLGSKFDTSGAPGLLSNPGTQSYIDKLGSLDPTQFNQQAADALYSQQTRYLDPQVQDQTRALQARLSEQGFVPGTPGYDQAMRTFQDTNARAYGGARDSATALGAQVGHQQFGDASSALNQQIAAALSSGGFQNQAHTQGVQDLLQQRQVPLSDLNTILGYLSGGSGASPTNAGTAAVPQGGVGALQTPDQISAYNDQYKNLLGGYNANVASDNNTTSTVGGLIGAIAIAF